MRNNLSIILCIIFLVIFCIASPTSSSTIMLPECGQFIITPPPSSLTFPQPRSMPEISFEQDIELAAMLKSVANSKLEKTNIKFFMRVADLCIEKGYYEEARKIAFRVVEKFPEELHSLFSIAYSYDKEGDLEKAVEYYLKTEKVDTYVFNLHNNFGYIYLRMGKIDVVKAEKELELEIRYNPSNYLPYINRAIVYRIRGENKKAFQDYAKAIELGPDIIDTYLIAARFCQQLKIYQKEGKGFLREAFKLDRNSWRAWEIKAGFYYNEGDYKKSEKAYLHSLKFNRRSTTLYELCWNYVKMGKLDLARKCYEEAKTLIPPDDPCYEYTARKYLGESGVAL